MSAERAEAYLTRAYHHFILVNVFGQAYIDENQTDLGIPYYDDVRKQMYLLFGDTFEGVNNMSGDWRSQTVGISKDFKLFRQFLFEENLR